MYDLEDMLPNIPLNPPSKGDLKPLSTNAPLRVIEPTTGETEMLIETKRNGRNVVSLISIIPIHPPISFSYTRSACCIHPSSANIRPIRVPRIG